MRSIARARDERFRNGQSIGRPDRGHLARVATRSEWACGRMEADEDEEEGGGGTLVMYWEKGFTLGAPPAPRYGHRMVLLNQTNVAAHARHHRQGQGLGLGGGNESDALLAELMLPCEVEVKIAVVGGCAVAPVRERLSPLFISSIYPQPY